MKTKFLTTAIFLTANAVAFRRGEKRQRQRSDHRQEMLVTGACLKRCLLLLLLIVCALAPSAWAEYLFVVTENSNGVTVIDSLTDQIDTKIPVGTFPVRICMSPDRLKAYVSNQKSATVSVVDTVQRTITATIQVGRYPQESAVTPDGRKLFLVHQSACGVTVIDTATNLVIANVPIGGNLAKDVLFTLDGRFAYIANHSEGTVNVIDTTIMTPPTG